MAQYDAGDLDRDTKRVGMYLPVHQVAWLDKMRKQGYRKTGLLRRLIQQEIDNERG